MTPLCALVISCAAGASGGPSSGGTVAIPAEQAARYPRDASRFALTPINDSTIAVQLAEAGWVRAGMEGIAVDPARGDALVARLRIITAREGRAEALVEGQTTRLSPNHVLLLVRPEVVWWRRRSFWGGALLGASFTGLATLVF